MMPYKISRVVKNKNRILVSRAERERIFEKILFKLPIYHLRNHRNIILKNHFVYYLLIMLLTKLILKTVLYTWSMNLMEYRPFNSYIVIFPSCERMSKQEEFDSPSSVTLYLLTLVQRINNQTRIVFKALYHRTLRFPHTLLTVIISTLPLRFALTPNETVITRSDSHNFSKRNETKFSST